MKHGIKKRMHLFERILFLLYEVLFFQIKLPTNFPITQNTSISAKWRKTIMIISSNSSSTIVPSLERLNTLNILGQGRDYERNLICQLGNC